ncbi:hypothetical protein DFH08DRAFT_808102 [Mycena albidolilacea]|uniref:Uncharacterized protein n=1 Tax=Mycena albidolilacea TaxID=1033008 RepID=A0AAD7ET07_9AGAR|nr:hypothetical protein DFH08DRAFT_808102 [Mycena albidolilacea]
MPIQVGRIPIASHISDSEWRPGNITLGVFELSSQVPSTLCVAPRALVALATAFPTGASYLALGQGAAQAIEDAGTLGVLLSAGTPCTEIPARLAAYEGLRKERTELIGRESHDQIMVPRERAGSMLEAYVVDYDVLAEARKELEGRFGGGHNVWCAAFFWEYPTGHSELRTDRV